MNNLQEIMRGHAELLAENEKLKAENCAVRYVGDLLCDLAIRLRSGKSTDEEELDHLIAMWGREQ